MTLARAVQLLRKEFGPNSFGSKKLLLFGGSSVRFAWFAGSFCHSPTKAGYAKHARDALKAGK